MIFIRCYYQCSLFWWWIGVRWFPELVDDKTNSYQKHKFLTKFFFHILQGSRVYPKIIGTSRFGVNETRRVTLSAAILEGLKLVQAKTDLLGGIVWIGKDIFKKWDNMEYQKYLDQIPTDKRVRLCIESLTNLTPEQLELAMEDAEQVVVTAAETPVLDAGDFSAEQQRSIVNQSIVCRCGTTKNMTNEGSVKRKVYVGGKRKMPCKQCVGCKAPKCGKCNPCLKLHLKKPCVDRVCRFPVVPKCPCFA